MDDITHPAATWGAVEEAKRCHQRLVDRIAARRAAGLWVSPKLLDEAEIAYVAWQAACGRWMTACAGPSTSDVEAAAWRRVDLAVTAMQAGHYSGRNLVDIAWQLDDAGLLRDHPRGS